MTSEELKKRSKLFALKVVNLIRRLPQGEEFRIISKQMLRSSFSTGANYRAACRARSSEEFIAKLCIVVEEIDETMYWLEILSEIVPSAYDKNEINEISKEAEELLFIFSSSRKTAKTNLLKHNN